MNIMDFKPMNEELTKTQASLEDAIRKTIRAEEELELAEIELIKKKSAHKKAKLDLQLYRSKMDSLKEQGYNLRQEAKL